MGAHAGAIGRRTVLQAAAVGLSLSLPGIEALAAAPMPFFKLHHLPLGLQLYTVGDAARKDLKGTLARIAAAGYKTLELAGLYGNRPSAMQRAVDAAGLQVTSFHLAAKSANGDPGFNVPPEVLAAALQELDVDEVVLPTFPIPDRLPQPNSQPGESFSAYLERIGPLLTVDDWKSIAAGLNQTAAVMAKVALHFHYHNHNVEFRPVGGTTGFQILLAETDPKLVHFELDVGWVAAGGEDPIRLLAQHKDRFRMMHVKDLLATTQTNYSLQQDPAEVGNGELPWSKLLKAAYAAGVRKFFVEQEPPFKGDPLDSVAISAKYLSTLI